MAMAGGPQTAYGSGGMATKLQAARIATRAGCTTLIADGTAPRPIGALRDSGRCTRFHADSTPAAIRKQWLAGALKVTGRLELDAGAVLALTGGGSLLPVGVVRVGGPFLRGDPVMLVDGQGLELGRGLVAYNSEEADKIAGCRSDEIEGRLGYRGRSVMIHRDDLVLFGSTM
jgi:glutamate 5-kinase